MTAKLTTRSLLATLLALVLVASACGDGDDAVPMPSEPEAGATATADGAGKDAGSELPAAPETTVVAHADGAAVPAPTTTIAATESFAATSSDDGHRAATGGEDATAAVTTATDEVVEPEPPVEPPQQLGLRAGSVDDNARWDEYLLYRERFAAYGIPVHDVYVEGRETVTVTNPEGLPVLGATVEIVDEDGTVIAAALTHSDGTALLFPPAREAGDQQQGAGPLQLVVAKGGARAAIDLDDDARTHAVTLEALPAPDPVQLDVHFLIDATGSMDDEIERLKANMISVAERIEALPANPDVRFGMTTYRDRGDLYVTRGFDFTADVTAFTQALQGVTAAGGDDYPESLNAGISEAVRSASWRVADTVSVMILIADAPPHLDYADDADYAVEALEAARRGIVILPIASSGLDDQGEYIFRQLAQITGGTFVFLTYGADGASPGDETTHHVDDYSVLALDDLVVQLVADQLAPLAG